MGTIMQKYDVITASGVFKQDPQQIEAIKIMENTRIQILESQNEWLQYQRDLKAALKDKLFSKNKIVNIGQTESKSQQQKGGFFQSFFHPENKKFEPQHKTIIQLKEEQKLIKQIPVFQMWKMKSNIMGNYLYGSPGSGKTFVMDIFYGCVDIVAKERSHFNEFMLNIHQQLHKHEKGQSDPLAHVAREIASDIRLLCLDEFQVTDIGDALILKQLFETLFDYNVVVVTTSNRLPDDLYKGGLQRHLFLPFIPFLNSRCHIINMDSQIDYRYSKTQKVDELTTSYYQPLDQETNAKMDRIFQKIAQQKPEAGTIQVMKGRSLNLKAMGHGVVMFDFDEITEKEYGASDFIAVSKNFHTVILRNVTKLQAGNKNAMRRLILLIDQLYTNKVKLFCSAERDLNGIFSVMKEYKDKKDDGETELFALDRCKSRIMEMQSKEYKDEKSYYDDQLSQEEQILLNS